MGSHSVIVSDSRYAIDSTMGKCAGMANVEIVDFAARMYTGVPIVLEKNDSANPLPP